MSSKIFTVSISKFFCNIVVCKQHNWCHHLRQCQHHRPMIRSCLVFDSNKIQVFNFISLCRAFPSSKSGYVSSIQSYKASDSMVVLPPNFSNSLQRSASMVAFVESPLVTRLPTELFPFINRFDDYLLTYYVLEGM